MRFIAIIEDTFREAAASYVTLIQLALTIVFVILLASISFTPGDADQSLQPFGPYLLEAQRTDPDATRLFQDYRLNVRNPFEVRGQDKTVGPPKPGSDYHLTLTVNCEDPGAGEELRRSSERMQEFLRREFGRLGSWRYFEVTDVRLQGDAAGRWVPNGARFELTTRPSADLRLAWSCHVTALFGLVDFGTYNSRPLGRWLWEIENDMMNTGAAWVVVLLSIVVTAGHIPNMLQKGSVDLLLVRPLTRVQLLLYRYLSGVLYVGVTVGLMFGAVWVVLGLRSGVWKPGLLLSVPVITFFFAVLYAASVLIGIISRNTVAAILMTCLVWFGLWLLSIVYAMLDSQRNNPGDNEWVYPVVDTLHAVLPRTNDLDWLLRKVLTGQLIDEIQARSSGGPPIPDITWGSSIAVSLGFIVALMSLGSWRFYRKDY
jgi:ABC-type transport system involved in multi-copper enzyme maturation permease subunit